MAYGLNSYKRTNIATADRRKIVVLLYEGAIGRLNKAVACVEGGQREEQAVHINKTLQIVKFLDNALDHDQGGDLARNLTMLYAYMRDGLTMANIENNADKIREVVSLLNTLLEGWRGILEQQPAGEAPEAASSADTSETPAAQETPAAGETAPSARKRLSLVG